MVLGLDKKMGNILMIKGNMNLGLLGSWNTNIEKRIEQNQKVSEHSEVTHLEGAFFVSLLSYFMKI